MSSSPPTEAPRRHLARWYNPAGWSLRSRLVAIMIVLLALLGLAVGASAEIYLHSQLYQRLDAQLDNAAKWAQGPPRDRGSRPSDPTRPSGNFGTTDSRFKAPPPGAQPG